MRDLRPDEVTIPQVQRSLRPSDGSANHAFAKKRVVINEQNTTFVRSDPCLGFRIFLHCEEMTHWRERLLPISYRLFCRDWMANLSARPQIEVFFSGKAGAMKSAGHVLNDVVGEFGQRVP